MKRLLACVLVTAALGVIDVQRPVGEQWSTRLTVSAIHLYQATLSRWYTRMGVQCRFTPTCSHYAESCVQRFGAARGGWMALARLLRCGPWTPLGTIDQPPAA